MFCLQYNLPLPTKVCTKEDFYKVVSSERVINKIAEFRKLKAEGRNDEADAKKRSLPIFIYQATFDETESKNGKKARWRKQQAAHLNGLVMLDIDHVENPVHIFGKMPKEWFEDGAKNQVMLVHITPSGKGLRVVFKADSEIGDLSANQHHLAQQLGVEPDEACKDASRASFAPQQEEILFINDAIFEYQNDEFDKRFGDLYRGGKGHTEITEITENSQPSDLKHHPSALRHPTRVFHFLTLLMSIGAGLVVCRWMVSVMSGCIS